MTRTLITALTSTLVVGGVALAQSGQRNDQQKESRNTFVSTSTILGAEVWSAGDSKQQAEVDDLIVDTRSNEAVYAIIDTKGILGSEDRVVAVPYSALAWDGANNRFSLQLTGDQLRQIPEFDAKKLESLHDASWYSTMRGIFNDDAEFTRLENLRGDEYVYCCAHSTGEGVNGTITSVNRQAVTAHGHTYYAVVVDNKESGGPRTVYLAPMTYLTSESSIPAEGDNIKVTTVKGIDSDGKVIYVAKRYELDGKTVRLRDDSGIPLWKHNRDYPAHAYAALASDLDSGSVIARGEKFGSVSDVVYEVASGTAAYTIVSVGGVLGVDDTLYAIPSNSLIRGTDGKNYLDMPVSDLKVAPKLSKDGIKDLNNPDFTKQVNEFYGIKQMKFDTQRSDRWKSSQTAGSSNGSNSSRN
jgi:sporulation protein YlmC with PRC-barrel domain